MKPVTAHISFDWSSYPHAKAALCVCDRLRDAGYRVLLAGGCVRDLLLGLTPKDFDVATNATPDEIAHLFPGSQFAGAAFGVQHVRLEEGTCEVATFRRDGPYSDGRRPDYILYADEYEDALRRDFTVNALYYNVHESCVLDYVNGFSDLKHRCIRAVGNPMRRFEEDYLRLLRAVRFASHLQFQMEASTQCALHVMAQCIIRVSPERIRDELILLLTESGAHRGLNLLDTSGLLNCILPEVVAMHGVVQPPEFHPEGDVWMHTLLMFEYAGTLSPALAFAILLHDVGKPVTQTFEDRIRFNYHDKEGEVIARDICHRLRVSRADTERICWLIREHMRVATVQEMRECRLKQFIRQDGFDELLELFRLDILSSHGDTSTIEWLESFIDTHNDVENLQPAPLLTGHDLIAMGYLPGPRFKQILSMLEDAQLEGVIQTRDEACDLVINTWSPDA